MNILVKSTNWVGDAVMQMPAIHALRQGFPEAHIAVAARGWVASLFGGCPDVDETIHEPSKKSPREKRAAFDETVRAREWDLGIALPNSFSSAKMLRRARAKRRVGYARDGRSLLLTDPVRLDPWLLHVHEIDYYLHLISRVTDTRDAERRPHLRFGEGPLRRVLARVAEQLSKQGAPEDSPLVALGAGAAFGTAKRWLPDRFAACARALRERHGLIPVLTGSWKETGTTAEIARLIGEPVVDLAGQGEIDELAVLLGHTRLFLTNDSGPMHIAAALGTPTVAVFGSTNWKTTAPQGPHVRLLRRPADCAPCLRRHCPIDHRCMTGIEVDRVLTACEELLVETDRTPTN